MQCWTNKNSSIFVNNNESHDLPKQDLGDTNEDLDQKILFKRKKLKKKKKKKKKTNILINLMPQKRFLYIFFPWGRHTV